MLREMSPEGIRDAKTDKKNPLKKMMNGKLEAKEENRMIAIEDHVETAENRTMHRTTAAMVSPSHAIPAGV